MGYGGFEVGLGLIQQPVAEEEPEVVEEPPEPEELPEEPGIEPVPRSQPTPVVTTVTETAVQEAAPSSEQLTLEVRPLTLEVQPRPAVPTPQQVAQTSRGQSPTYGGAPGILDLYIAQQSARLNRFKYYPIRSLRQGEEGVPVLALVIDRRGRVLDAEIAVSSGFEELDRAALRIAENAKPLPRFDRRMQMVQLRARIPIKFEVPKGNL